MPALEALLKLSPAFEDSGAAGGGAIGKEHEADFMLLQERCNDVSLSTRKASACLVSCRFLCRMPV